MGFSVASDPEHRYLRQISCLYIARTGGSISYTPPNFLTPGALCLIQNIIPGGIILVSSLQSIPLRHNGKYYQHISTVADCCLLWLCGCVGELECQWVERTVECHNSHPLLISCSIRRLEDPHSKWYVNRVPRRHVDTNPLQKALTQCSLPGTRYILVHTIGDHKKNRRKTQEGTCRLSKSKQVLSHGTNTRGRAFHALKMRKTGENRKLDLLSVWINAATGGARCCNTRAATLVCTGRSQLLCCNL